MQTITKEAEMLENKTAEALKEFFSPEFLNRIDDIVTFNKLDDNTQENDVVDDDDEEDEKATCELSIEENKLLKSIISQYTKQKN